MKNVKKCVVFLLYKVYIFLFATSIISTSYKCICSYNKIKNGKKLNTIQQLKIISKCQKCLLDSMGVCQLAVANQAMSPSISK